MISYGPLLFLAIIGSCNCLLFLAVQLLPVINFLHLLGSCSHWVLAVIDLQFLVVINF